MRIEASSNTSNYTNQSDQIQKKEIQMNSPETVKEDKTKDSILAAELAHQLFSEQKGEMTISEKVLDEAIDRANKAIIGSKREFRYSVHKATNEVMIKVLNSETGDVVREIPPEKMLDLVAKLWELAGVFVDERR